ncbi:hypothetical protein FHL15_004856 [Xylaria flabelliformis]|uniref:Uncharacterized protein n=1 Tax=Xylaria flabelliformis TaxID=2512241 RepID=A0A553I2F8_9PEZI|nr:hypothetical protein FHL15_004856 [Xylaria flabelliformis]
MPQDPNLYGQRPAKKQKREIPLSSSLAFTSQLSSLITAPTTSSPSTGGGASSSFSSGRPRPSKSKDDIFSVKAKRKPGATTTTANDDDAGSDNNNNKIRLKHVHNTEEEKKDFARARRKMEEKARLYAAMKRGDYVAKENEAAPLVDFDRKWAERHPEDDHERYSSSGSDNESSDNDDGQEMIEYQDEFGRTRTGTRAEAQRQERRAARAALGAAELEDMAAVPTARPRNLIFGDAIQTGAFAPEDATLDAMATLAAKRDREPTPPPDTHFDGSAEIRTKGTGFYQFSRDEEARAKEMENLKVERENTERVRSDREKEKERRRREIEERRKKIGKRRAEKMAENFLDGLAGEIGIAAGRAGKGDKDEEESKSVSTKADP